MLSAIAFIYLASVTLDKTIIFLGHQRLKSSGDHGGGSTWKRLLSTMMPRSNEPQRGSRSRPNLTLSSGLNAENTLRLEAHRQLFQSHDLIRSGGEDPYLNHYSYDTSRPLGGLQYFPTVSENFGVSFWGLL